MKNSANDPLYAIKELLPLLTFTTAIVGICLFVALPVFTGYLGERFFGAGLGVVAGVIAGFAMELVFLTWLHKRWTTLIKVTSRLEQ